MTLGKWQHVIAERAHDQIKADVQEAVNVGQEEFTNVVREASMDLITSAEFQRLATALVVGNIAFDAKPEMEIGEAGNYLITVRIDAQ